LNSSIKSFDAAKLETLLQYVKYDWKNINEKKIAYKFPNVSAEILSTGNDKISDFFSTRSSTKLVHLDFLLQFFVDQQFSSEPYNYTRSGYICKILNNLVLNKAGVFESYLLKRDDYLSALIASCHCKSAATTVLNIITLISTNVQTPMMIAAAAGVIDNKNEVCTSNVIADAVEQTLKDRIKVFTEIIETCINSASKEDQLDLHSNLAWIIMQVLSKNTSDRSTFVRVFLEKLPQIVDIFASTFEMPANNKLGNVFLVILELMSKDYIQGKDKEDQHQEVNSSSYCLAELPTYLVKCFNALTQCMESIKNADKSGHFTHTFSTEIHKLNPRIYKVLEAANVAFNLYITRPEFVREVILSSSLPKYAFSFLTDYPFNNILHNQIKKMLFLILEKGSEDLIDFFFANNENFFQFINNLTANKHINLGQGKKIKHGFIGQTITIVNALKSKSTKGNQKMAESILIR